MIQKFKLSKKILVVGVICLVLVSMAYFYANAHENSKYVKPIGKLIMGTDQALHDAIIDYCQQDSHLECDTKVLGHDDKYAYALLHRTWYDDIHTKNAKGGTVAVDQARYTYTPNPLKITAVAYQGDDNVGPSIQSLYPRPMYDSARKMWFSWISQPSMDARAKQ